MSPTVVTIICLCLASFVGLCLGSLKVKGIGIGVAGVLFAGLIMVILIGLVVEFGLFRAIEAVTVRRWGMQR